VVERLATIDKGEDVFIQPGTFGETDQPGLSYVSLIASAIDRSNTWQHFIQLDQYPRDTGRTMTILDRAPTAPGTRTSSALEP